MIDHRSGALHDRRNLLTALAAFALAAIMAGSLIGAPLREEGLSWPAPESAGVLPSDAQPGS